MNPDPENSLSATLPATTLLVIPVYNHPATLRHTAEKALAVHPDLLVVDDGSDIPVAPLLEGLSATCIRHARNMGKGRAIRSAAAWAAEHGYSHMVTLDADGQHDPKDARLFVRHMLQDADAILVGARDFTTSRHVPFASRFGRVFSAFWMRVQTGVAVSDMQSGFRLYPIAALQKVACAENRFAFEIEILVRSAWAGFPIRNVPVSVYYPPPDTRVSHFKILADNFRISMLNTRLTMRAMFPVPPRQIRYDEKHRFSLLHPLRSLRLLQPRGETPARLACSAALGTGLAAMPLYGLHTMLVLALCGYCRMNKALALGLNQLALLPLFPAMAVELGHCILQGQWLTEISWQTLGREAGHRFVEWALGSLILAPFLAGATWLLVYGLAKNLLKEQNPAVNGDADGC